MMIKPLTSKILLAATMGVSLFCLAPVQAAAAPKHVILIMMENHGTGTLLGNKDDAPFINELITQKGVSYATQYYGVTHPSLPNYLALVSGDFYNIHDDCKAGADVTCKAEEFVPDSDDTAIAGEMLTDEQLKQAAETAHLFKTKTFIDQLDDAKKSWKIYMQGLPADQKLAEYGPLDANGKVAAKLYAQKHNPFLYFANFRDDQGRLAKLLPYDGFADDLKGGLTDFTWISPDQCHDMHGIAPEAAAAIQKPECGYPKSGLDHSVIKLGDDYLRETVSAIRAAPVWKDDTAIVIVWDEDDYNGAAGVKGSPVGRNGVTLGGSRAPLIVVTSKDAAPRNIDVPLNHYNLLASLEAAYGTDCLAHACEAKDALVPDLFQ